MGAYEDLIAEALCFYGLQETSGTSFAEANGGAAATCLINASAMNVAGPTSWLPVGQALDGTGLNFIQRTGLSVSNLPTTMLSWIKFANTSNNVSWLSAWASTNNHIMFRWDYNLPRGYIQARSTSGGDTTISGPQSTLNFAGWNCFGGTLADGACNSYFNGTLVTNAQAVASHYAEYNQFLMGTFRPNSNPASGIAIAGCGLWARAFTKADDDVFYAGPKPTTLRYFYRNRLQAA